MVRHSEDEIDYYYDSHSTEKDLAGEPSIHAMLVHYLVNVLSWMFREQVCAIYKNFNFYYTPDRFEYPMEPDVAVIKGVRPQEVRSWKVGWSGPAPQIVLEIASWKRWWVKNLEEKPGIYARMGVEEYYAYDPNEPPLPRSSSRRLFGWQMNPQQAIMRPMTPASNGALWSTQLESWLLPDGTLLRLYDRNGQMRLTESEAESRQAEIQARRAEAEAWRAEIESKRAEEALRQAKAMADKLRSLGVDPDQLL